MTRAAIALVVLLAISCIPKPVIKEPEHPGAEGLGGRSGPGTPVQRHSPGGGATPETCREINRVRCDTDRCKGYNLDYVTLSCGAREVHRCVANTTCGGV